CGTLEPREIFLHLGPEPRGVLMIVFEVVIAAFRADGEAGRNRKPDAGHLGESRTLPAEYLLHIAGAFRFARPKKVDVFHVVFCPLKPICFSSLYSQFVNSV